MKWTKEYRREYQKEYQKKWREENPRYFKNWLKTKKGQIYLIRKKEYFKEYFTKRRKIDIRFRFDNVMKSAISESLRGKNKNRRKWQKLVGYTLQDLMVHLENQFNKNMSWGNYGNYWELDHKTPQSWFKYLKAEDEEFKKCWALENLQPLEKSANRKKYNCYIN